jgi:hypothetical protein
MDLNKRFNKLFDLAKYCGPAKFYLLLSFVSVVIYGVHLMGKGRKKYALKELGSHVVLMIIWTVVLNKVCSLFKHGEKISWVLVFLPVLFFILLMVSVVKIMDHLDIDKNDLHKMIKDANRDGGSEDELEGFQGCG